MSNILLESDFLSALIAFAVILIPAIIIHELGHLLAAKLVGIKVLEFGVGFPPRVVKLFRWGETDFTLNLLPIGGFVMPYGEDMIGPVEDDEQYDEYDEYDAVQRIKAEKDLSPREQLLARGVAPEDIKGVNDVKPLSRIIFMIGGAAANFVSAILLLMLVGLLGIPTDVGARLQVTEIPPGSAFDIEGVETGDAIELINGEYIESATTFFQRLTAAQGDSIELTMRSSESGERYSITLSPDVDDEIQRAVLVDAILENSPAQRAGLRADDLIVAIAGEPLTSDADPVEQIVAASEEFAGQPLSLTIARDGEELEISLVPRENPSPQEGRIGIAIRSYYRTSDQVVFLRGTNLREFVPLSLVDSVQYGFAATFDTLNAIVRLPLDIINGVISPEEARPVSVVGVSQVGGQLLQQSIQDGAPSIILNFVALVSIFLGFTNLLPLPPLDGGRVLFVLIEVIRGKPVSPQIEVLIYKVGIAFLLSLGLVIILYDIFNPFVLPQ